jgi:putative hydrolase of the HAD superfamily
MTPASRRATPPVEAVLLDAAGTLMTPAEPVGETYARFAGGHGAEVDSDRLLEAFAEAFDRMPPMAFPAMAPAALERKEQDWWRRLVHEVMTRTQSAPNDFDAFFKDLYAHYADSAGWRLYPEVLETLKQLRAEGFALAVVSNFDSRLVGILHGLGVTALVDGIVFSTAAGVAKPNPGIFHQALDALDVDPARAVHVGDAPEPDYSGARAAGLSALLVVRNGAAPGVPSEHQIADLDGVRVWIETRERKPNAG